MAPVATHTPVAPVAPVRDTRVRGTRQLSEASERAATAAREHAAALDAACREKQQVSMLA